MLDWWWWKPISDSECLQSSLQEADNDGVNWFRILNALRKWVDLKLEQPPGFGCISLKESVCWRKVSKLNLAQPVLFPRQHCHNENASIATASEWIERQNRMMTIMALEHRAWGGGTKKKKAEGKRIMVQRVVIPPRSCGILFLLLKISSFHLRHVHDDDEKRKLLIFVKINASPWLSSWRSSKPAKPLWVYRRLWSARTDSFEFRWEKQLRTLC